MQTARELERLIYVLLLVGLIFIYNSSIVHSQAVFGSPHRFFLLHLSWIILGLIGLKIFAHINLDKFIKLGPFLYFITFGMLAFLALWGIIPCAYSTAFAPCINNANRWLVLNPSPLPSIPFIGELGFQPSELAKIVLIIFLAIKLVKAGTKTKDKNLALFKIFAFYTFLYCFLVMLQPNMSTAILLFALGSILYLSISKNASYFLYLVPVMLVAAVFFVLISPYRRERLLVFLDKTNTSSEVQEGYQVKQVKLALGSGGIFGVGFGQSRQKYTYLPEVATDSIFAVIGEEFGFIGSLVICILFILVLKKGFLIAQKTTDPTKMLIAVGLTSWIGIQFIIHMFANSGLIPYTGIPLPFISYGGTSLFFSLVAIGVLINISKSNHLA